MPSARDVRQFTKVLCRCWPTALLHYLREPEIMNFLGPVPTVWHDTKVLQAKMGDYIVIARRHDRDWYVGAMTDWTARELQINFSFLPTGTWQLEEYQGWTEC